MIGKGRDNLIDQTVGEESFGARSGNTTLKSERFEVAEPQ
jgi:hypothetical protein